VHQCGECLRTSVRKLICSIDGHREASQLLLDELLHNRKRQKTTDYHLAQLVAQQQQTPQTPAHVGQEALDALGDLTKFEASNVPGGGVVFSEEDVHVAAQFNKGQEKEFNVFLVPRVAGALPGNRVIALSEEIPWLVVNSKHAKLNKKPDFTVLSKAFYSPHPAPEDQHVAARQQYKENYSFRFGVPATMDSKCSFLAGETKIPDNAQRRPTPAHLGTAIIYGLILRDLRKTAYRHQAVPILLVTPTEFWLVEVGVFALGLSIWRWDQPGSMEALSQFVPKAPFDELDELCSEAKVQVADPLDTSTPTVLGLGGSAVVFRVLPIGTDRPRSRDYQALKVIEFNGGEEDLLLQTEHSLLQSHADICACKLLVRPQGPVVSTKRLSGFVMAPVGSPVTHEVLALRGFPTASNVLDALVALHQHGHVHGDPRISNVLMIEGDQLMWIDFRLGFPQSVLAAQQRDVALLLKSLLNLPDLSDELKAAVRAYQSADGKSETRPTFIFLLD
jgi:hypothetical protein